MEIFPNENDDKNFFEIIKQILNFTVNLTNPKEVFIVKVDHCFDFKWRAFSNKSFGAVGMWHEPLRIPPFIPDRIVEEIYFQKSDEGYQRKDSNPLHIYQPSDENAGRKINRKSALFIWFSSDTLNNSQASLMVYSFTGDLQNSWYVSFIKKSGWQIYKTNNISRTEIKSIVEDKHITLMK